MVRESVIFESGRPEALLLCTQCFKSLKRGRTPEFSLVNHMFLGKVPFQLRELTVIEEAMIARTRARSWIIQLQEAGGGAPNVQQGVRSHIIVFPQQPEWILNILPPPVDEIVTLICVIFIGSSVPSKEWLKRHAHPLVIQKEKVFAALTWLCAHNPFYGDVAINRAALNVLDECDVLPVHIEVVPSSVGRDSLTSRYDGVTENVPSYSENECSFESVVVTNVEPNAPPHVLRAAAMEHVARAGKGYIQIPHAGKPVGDINNPSFFPLMYPTLFPYGLGAPEEGRRARRVSLKRHIKYFLSLSDTHFQTHYSFIFTAFSVLQRRSILLQCYLKIDRGLFDRFKADFALVSPSAVHTVAERLLAGDHETSFTGEEKRVRELLKQVSHVTSCMPASSSARTFMRNEIKALMIEKGLPTFYVTINPADVYNPVLKFMCGTDFDLDNMMDDDVPDFWAQSVLVAKNPVIASRFFHLCMSVFVETVLGYTDNVSESSSGVLGQVSAYYGCVEAQGRGSLHCHLLIWLTGSLNCDQIRDHVLREGDTEFGDRLLAFLDDTISTSIPNDPLPTINTASSCHHPCSVHGPRLDDNNIQNQRLQRVKDIHFLATSCQQHKHTSTCFKYWKGPPEARECRFGLDEQNCMARSFVDNAMGDVNLCYLNGMANRYNPTILECIRCNMDIQFVGSGGSAKAVLYYITDYITKTQLKAHIAYSALDVAVSRLGDYDPVVDDLRTRAKRLLQKCAYSMLSHQELSAQQVSSYLLEQGDHYTSHSFRCLYWTSFERSIDKDLLSPECYPTQGQQNQQDVQDGVDSDMGSGDDSSEISDTESTVHESEFDEITAVFISLWKAKFRKSRLGDSRARTPGAAEWLHS